MQNKIESPRPAHLPDAELAVMQALWAAGGTAARPTLDEALAARCWGATTILNLLARLEGRGFVTRQKQSKGYLYTAAVTEKEYLAAESTTVLDRAFRGSAKQFIAALYAGNSLSKADISELDAYLKQLQKEG